MFLYLLFQHFLWLNITITKIEIMATIVGVKEKDLIPGQEKKLGTKNGIIEAVLVGREIAQIMNSQQMNDPGKIIT